MDLKELEKDFGRFMKLDDICLKLESLAANLLCL
jgi:hypothetical protein